MDTSTAQLENEVESRAPEMRPFHVVAQKKADPASVSVFAPKGTENCPVELAKRTKSTEKLMRGIDTFFSNPEHMGKLLPFLQQDPKNKPKISMRLIEWFVSLYCLNHTVDWFLGADFFNVYLDYQSMMEEHGKQLFDPFGRKWRKEKRKSDGGDDYVVQVYHGIRFYYTDADYVITTVAQLNFFRWFIEKKILEYMIDHRKDLTDEMNKHNKEIKTKKREPRQGKEDKEDKLKANKKSSPTKKQISERVSATYGIPVNADSRKVRVQATKKVTKKNVEVYVSFD